MSLFPQARGFQINNSQFTAITNNNTYSNTYLSGPTGIDILREASAPEAVHDSSARSYSPRCFPGTREQYIEDIVRRATPSLDDTPLPIYWMKGPAGVGKSAIAQTCTERLQERGTLGASFFFSINGQRKPEKFFPSIAYQLSTIHPDYRDLVDRKVHNDNTLIDKAMRFQFRLLIDEPLRELEENGKGFRKAVQIFIDGLDECENVDAQCEIIQIVAASASGGVLPLRWAFFSRPEPHIEATFSLANVAPHCYTTMLPVSRDADGEIELYLRNTFDNNLKRNNPSTRTLWPSIEEMNIIVQGAGGSFIFATTVARFVTRPDTLSPQKRLLAIIDIILERRSHPDITTTAPLAELDEFYMLILRRVPTEIFPSVHLFLALMCRFVGLGAIHAANMLMMSKDEFETICHHASVVIRLEEPGKELELDPSVDTSSTLAQAIEGVSSEISDQITCRLGGQLLFYHKSFYDFLFDPARSGSYCVKASETLANHLVKVHLDCDRTFFWRGSELVLAPSIPDSAASLSYPYGNELANSVLKANIYSWAGDEDWHSFSMPRETGGLNAACDFRKWLYTYTTISPPGQTYYYRLWDRGSLRKIFRGCFMEYISRGNFPKPAITEFKSMIKWREEAGIIRPHHPNLSSRIKSLLHSKLQEGTESVLYRVGHGEKSIFWYLEINHALESYRGFRSIDLAEGEKRFREENFDTWR